MWRLGGLEIWNVLEILRIILAINILFSPSNMVVSLMEIWNVLEITDELGFSYYCIISYALIGVPSRTTYFMFICYLTIFDRRLL